MLETGSKTQPPSIEFISAFKKRVMSLTEVLVFFIDHSALLLTIDPTTTAADVVTEVSTRIKLQTARARQHPACCADMCLCVFRCKAASRCSRSAAVSAR